MTTAPTTPAAAPRLVRFALPVLLVLAVATLLAAVLLPTPWSRRTPAVPTTEVGDLRFPLPEFTLKNRDGQAVTKADLAGKVWVASFVFTRCTGPCPSVTATVARLQTELDLANQDNLRLVTITVDPERDRPKELDQYAAKFNAHPTRWLFLTGEEAYIHNLLKESFKIGVSRSPDPAPVAGQEFAHSTYLEVVDKAGVVRGHFDGYQGPNDAGGANYQAKLAELKALVTRLLAE